MVIPSYFPPLPLSVYYSILIPGPAPSASLLSKLQAQYPDIPSLGCPFDTGNNTFNMTGSFKQMAAIVSDGMFQSRRRFFLKQANLHNNTKTWTYQFEVGAPDVPAYKGCEYRSFMSNTGCC